MILKSLNISNYKNIASASLDFSPRLNCFLGDNGMGKSNLLDSVFYLGYCRSFTGAPDSLVIRRGEEFMLLQAVYERRGASEDLNISLGGGRRKSVKRGGKEYGRLSEHIGLFPAVMISPSDMDLVSGPGEVRRRFMDMVISQSDPKYLNALIRYNNALENRNKLLRSDIRDAQLFMAYESAMDAAATVITAGRRHFVARLSEMHGRYYGAVTSSAENEPTTLVLNTQIDNDPDGSLANILDHRRERDRMLGYTSAGPHRDDLEMTLGGLPLRRTASQGQTKTFTIALRLAQYEFLSQAVEMKPLLLLDDIFDKLDAHRVENIINLVTQPGFGQIFITDTNRKHLDEILSRHRAEHALWSVSGGVFTAITEHA